MHAVISHEEFPSAMHKNVGLNLRNIATLYVKQRNYEQAGVLYELALAILDENLGPTHPLILETFKSLTYLYRLQGKID